MSDHSRGNILLIEDEAGLIMTIQDRLMEEKFHVETAADGEEGFQYAKTGVYDVIILDLMLPKKDGLEVCKDLRKLDIETPIIMLTAKGQVLDKVLGLKLGADDYMQKPFEMMELLARIEVQLRKKKNKSTTQNPEEISFGDVVLDARKMKVSKNGEEITLSAKEFQLLQFMVLNDQTILSRDQLLNEVWGYDALPSTRTVDVHIAWLRQKLEVDSRYPKHILTVHGFGYKFVR